MSRTNQGNYWDNSERTNFICAHDLLIIILIYSIGDFMQMSLSPSEIEEFSHVPIQEEIIVLCHPNKDLEVAALVAIP